MKGRIFGVVGGMLLLTVCSKGAAPAREPSAGPTPPASTNPPSAAPAPASASGSAAGGTITGKVKFTGTPPRMATIDMSEEAACKAKYPSPPKDEAVVAGAGNTLADVFVYVSAGLPANAKYQAPAEAVVLDQNGCRYHPHVLGIMVGQKLEIKNSDPLLHNIKAVAKKNRGFNVSQPNAGMTRDVTFSAPEVMVNLVQRARLDEGLCRRPARSVLRGERPGWQLHDQGSAAGDVYDRSMAREVRHADGYGHDRGDREQDGQLHLRRALARGEPECVGGFPTQDRRSPVRSTRCFS